jgi:uncharacterized protein involved in exopolysaccharide biosynthesis
MGDWEEGSPRFNLPVGDFVRVLLDRWPILLGVGIAGAAIGLGVSLLRPPVYEARATVGVAINYALTQPLELVVEDRVYDRVVAIMMEDEMMGQVLAELPADLKVARGWALPADLRESLRVDRKLSQWDLTVDDPDPQLAASVANIWAETALGSLSEALDHAWRVAELVVAASDAEEFTPEKITVDWWGGPIWECQIVPIHIDENVLSDEIQEQLLLSRGLFPSLVIEPMQRAVPPERPVLWDRGTFVLSGGLLGLTAAVLGLLLTAVPFRGRA